MHGCGYTRKTAPVPRSAGVCVTSKSIVIVIKIVKTVGNKKMHKRNLNAWIAEAECKLTDLRGPYQTVNEERGIEVVTQDYASTIVVDLATLRAALHTFKHGTLEGPAIGEDPINTSEFLQVWTMIVNARKDHPRTFDPKLIHHSVNIGGY
jgi:hypothetical protein